jgi:O-antigen/teichoic acid export membrane protein
VPEVFGRAVRIWAWLLKRQILEIGRDSAWYLFATVSSSLIAFIAVPIFTRVLVPREYGVYSLIAGTVTIASSLTTIWLAVAIVRFYPEYENKGRLDEYYSTIYHYAPHLLAAVLLLVLPVVFFLAPLGRYKSAICLGIAIFPVFWVFRVSQAIFRARRLSKYYAIQAVLVDSGRYLLGAALVAWMGLGVKGIFIGWLSMMVLVVFIQIAILSLWKYFRWSKYSPELERELLRFGIPLIAANILSMLLSVGDRYVIAAFKGTAQVGLYTVVYSLSLSLIVFLVSFVELATSPVVTRTYENEGEEEAVAIIRTITRYFLVVLTPSVIAMWLLRIRVMSVITSAKYISAASVILPILLGVALGELAFLPSFAFFLKKRTRLQVWPVGVATASNIALNLFLVPFFGYKGSAWATLASYALYLGMITVIGGRLMRWDFPWIVLARVSAATGVMGVSLYFLNRVHLHIRGVFNLALLIVLGTVIYLGALMMLGEFTTKELALGLSLLKRLPLIRRLFKQEDKSL